jgi:hypothetical protein
VCRGRHRDLGIRLAFVTTDDHFLHLEHADSKQQYDGKTAIADFVSGRTAVSTAPP